MLFRQEAPTLVHTLIRVRERRLLFRDLVILVYSCDVSRTREGTMSLGDGEAAEER